MQKYYISRPRCRFSLRILPSPVRGSTKARGEDVVYAPGKSVQEAVQKAVGKDVAAACEWIDTSSAAYAEALAEDNAEADEDPIVLEAFLPKPTIDPAVICKKPTCTHFIFVDSRSVSCTRGTLKQIHALYKSYFKSASSAPGLSDPFVYLNICCPPSTYDPNIEPAKDDVLFHDGDAVVKVVEKMLARFYGELKTEERAGKQKVVERTMPNGFELLLARKPKTSANVVTSPSKEQWPKQLPPPPKPAEIMDYNDLDEDEEEMAAMAVDTVMEEEMDTGGPAAVNSSAMSKQRRTKVGHTVEDEDHLIASGDELVRPTNALMELEQIPTPPEPGTAAPAPSILPPGTGPLVTPRRKSTGWGFNMSGGLPDSDSDDPMNGELAMHESDNEETVRRDITLSNPWTAAKMNAPIVSSPISSSPASTQRAGNPARKPFNPPIRTGNRHGSPVLPEMVLRGTPEAFPTPAPSSPSAGMFGGGRGSVVRMRPGKEPAGGSVGLMNSWISRTPRGEDGSPPRARKSTGFVSAANLHSQRIAAQDDDDDGGGDVEQQQQQPGPGRSTRMREPIKRTAPVPEPSKRRRLDNTQTNSFTPINDPTPSRSPHRNRFLAATAALSTSSSTHDPPLPPLPRQRRRRTKTLLPLDAVPEASLQTHHFSRTVDLVAGGSLKHLFTRLRACDAYVGATATGAATEVEGVFFSECAAWNNVAVLGGLVKGWMLEVAREEEEEEGVVQRIQSIQWEMGEGEEEGGRVLLAVEAEEMLE